MNSEELNKRVNEIQAILVQNYGKDAAIDDYQIAVIRGIMLANFQTEKELKKVTDLVTKNVKPKVNNYDNLSAKAAFMLKWGWGIWLILALLILGGFYTYTNTPKEIIPPALQNSIQYENGKYYILQKNYTLRKGENGKAIGINIKQ